MLRIGGSPERCLEAGVAGQSLELADGVKLREFRVGAGVGGAGTVRIAVDVAFADRALYGALQASRPVGG